jgi:tRNA threonylcarbamoyladenosine biosynthesis protein TsaE
MEVISKSVRDTLNIGRALARHLRRGDIICLFGELGSGKTVLTKGIAWGLGIKRSLITSPSFVIIHEYIGKGLPLYHLDLYRLKTEEEILSLGYEEYLFGDGVSVIEWADKLNYILPKDYLKIELSVKSKTQRLLRFTAAGNRFGEGLKVLMPDSV